MAYQHGYEFDLFISHAWIGSKPDPWVTALRRALQDELQRIGAKGARIWIDGEQMKAGSQIQVAMVNGVRKSAIFLAVVSPNWKNSTACQTEFKTFLERLGPESKNLEKVPLLAAVQVDTPDLDQWFNDVLRESYVDSRRPGTPSYYRPTTKTFRDITGRLASAAKEVLELLTVGKATPTPDLSDLVMRTREAVRPLIQETCGTMKVLDMSHPIDLASLYTDVNILATPEHLRHLPEEELLKRIETEGKGRMRFTAGAQERLNGFEAVRRYPRLMVLGKPGAGKTTYLKRLAFECAKGTFREDLVPCLVTLRDFAESPAQWSLPDFVAERWEKRGVSKSQSQAILSAGKVLLLLDGLDEVREAEFGRVRKQVEELCVDYPDVIVVMTCRIAAAQYCFEKFGEVEMADFDDQQINHFAENWFNVRAMPEKAAPFREKLRANPAVLELASSPLLLTMLCLIFESRTDLDGNRAEIYDKGLDVLLNKWDGTRGIERDWPYRNMNTAQRRMLLSEIAYTQFQREAMFFKQAVIEEQIAKYFGERPNLLPDRKSVDPRQVLKSVEAQHGVLVERARGIYSFSHLTFQEYLTAQRVRDKQSLVPELAAKVGDPKWREVLVLTAAMVDGDDLLPILKSSVDGLADGVGKIQSMLAWACNRATGYRGGRPNLEIRTFYLNLANILEIGRTRYIRLGLNRDFVFERDINIRIDFVLSRLLTADDLSTVFRDLSRSIVLVQRSENHSAAKALRCLQMQLPSFSERFLPAWRDGAGLTWKRRLRELIVEYLKLGHDWNLSPEERSNLDRYGYANQTLVACMNAAPGIKKSTRQWILDTMLLPESELQKHPRPK